MKATVPEPAATMQSAPRRGITATPELLPAISPVVVRWFVWYSRRYLRRSVHSFRVSRENLPAQDSGKPLVIYLNHASWWDPLVILLLTQSYFPNRTFVAPMDAGALERYGFFRRIGCFGVELGTKRGAKQFLGTSLAALEKKGFGLCVTPQGRFADVRERPVHFEAGLGQLAYRIPDAIFLPVAVEYVFWEERLPEILVRFGAAVYGCEFIERDPVACTMMLEDRLRITQDALAADSLSRQAERFTNVLSGNVGVGGVYDGWRRFRSWLRGERFAPEHSSL